MAKEITLVDRGRGLQLSTSRITVLDLVPYFQEGHSHDEIMRWLPTLSREEIMVVEKYYLEHKEELDEQDGRACAYREEQVRLQRLCFPEATETAADRTRRLRRLLERRRLGKNGERDSG